MEENNNQEVVNTETTVVVENANNEEVVHEVDETQVVQESPENVQQEESVVTENVDTTTKPEFLTADQIGGTPLEEAPLTQKKKVNKTLIIVLIFALVFGGAMLLMTFGNKGGNFNGGNQEKEEETIKVKTGTEWGNKYLTYLMTAKKDLKTYEVSFINVNETEEPEMFVRYIDNSDKQSLRIFYIAEDGFVYESKYYRDFKLRYIYSLKDQTIDWYLYLTTNKSYGTYTKISNIINNMAFDADIKTTTDALLIEYGKKYYDTDYQPIFYTIKEKSMEDDFRDFVSKYKGYNEKVEELKTKTLEKYKDYEYKEEVKEDLDSVGIAGRVFKYGTYYAVIPADPDNQIEEHTRVITLLKNNKICVEGILYDYTINYDDSMIEFGDRKNIQLLSGKFNYQGKEYIYIGE